MSGLFVQSGTYTLFSLQGTNPNMAVIYFLCHLLNRLGPIGLEFMVMSYSAITVHSLCL